VRAVLSWLQARAENVAVGLLTVMFLAFVVQIASRYVFNAPMGWTLELCLTTWLWVVLWGAAFCLDNKDHVSFDIFYLSGSAKVRRVFAIVSALAIAGALIASLPATIDYITFYKIKKSATLHIRLDYVFSIYGAFAVAVIVRYLWRAVSILRGASPDEVTVGHDTLIAGEEIHRP
jgi:C4-dicarboxylate transporter, DctQ subunit